MVNSGILVMLHITLSDVICERMMLNLSAIVMLTAGVLSILHTTPEFVISFHLLVRYVPMLQAARSTSSAAVSPRHTSMVWSFLITESR